jgi:hypothetical protein
VPGIYPLSALESLYLIVVGSGTAVVCSLRDDVPATVMAGMFVALGAGSLFHLMATRQLPEETVEECAARKQSEDAAFMHRFHPLLYLVTGLGLLLMVILYFKDLEKMTAPPMAVFAGLLLLRNLTAWIRWGRLRQRVSDHIDRGH